jgi:uncharacterized protein YodC (DUF2158 family)
MVTQFRIGDFVRLKKNATGPVGVVSNIHTLSVEVKWADSASDKRPDTYKPEDLQLAQGKLPANALKLKQLLSHPEPY